MELCIVTSLDTSAHGQNETIGRPNAAGRLSGFLDLLFNPIKPFNRNLFYYSSALSGGALRSQLFVFAITGEGKHDHTS